MTSASFCAFRAQVGMIFQDFNLFDHLTAGRKYFHCPAQGQAHERKEARARALDELARVELARKKPALSGPAFRRPRNSASPLPGALAMDPRVMLLDETLLRPSTLSLWARCCSPLSGDLAAGGMTMVAHGDAPMDNFARALADEILFMERGRIIERGSPANLLADGATTRTRDFCVHTLEVNI